MTAGTGAVSRRPMSDAAAELSDAIVFFVGRGRSASPCLNWNGAAGRFPAETRKTAESIVAYLDTIPTAWSVEPLDTAGARVSADLRSMYPDLRVDAIDALVWKFDYDWK